MKSPSRHLAALLTLVFMGLVVASAHAQLPVSVTKVEAETDDPEIIMQNTPDIEAGDVKDKRAPKTRQWLEVELPFQLESDSKIGIVPEIVIRFYLGVKTADGVNLALTDTFTYTNVPDGEVSYAVVYISPYSLARIAGGMDKFDEGDLAAWGVEILHNGVRVAGDSSNRNEWWNGMAQQNGMILPKEKTPFSVLWYDRHIELKQGN